MKQPDTANQLGNFEPSRSREFQPIADLTAACEFGDTTYSVSPPR